MSQKLNENFDSKIAVDPFYSASNMRYLEQKMEDYKAGKLKFAAHELIEE